MFLKIFLALVKTFQNEEMIAFLLILIFNKLGKAEGKKR